MKIEPQVESLYSQLTKAINPSPSIGQPRPTVTWERAGLRIASARRSAHRPREGGRFLVQADGRLGIQVNIYSVYSSGRNTGRYRTLEDTGLWKIQVSGLVRSNCTNYIHSHSSSSLSWFHLAEKICTFVCHIFVHRGKVLGDKRYNLFSYILNVLFHF